MQFKSFGNSTQKHEWKQSRYVTSHESFQKNNASTIQEEGEIIFVIVKKKKKTFVIREGNMK